MNLEFLGRRHNKGSIAWSYSEFENQALRLRLVGGKALGVDEN